MKKTRTSPKEKYVPHYSKTGELINEEKLCEGSKPSAPRHELSLKAQLARQKRTCKELERELDKEVSESTPRLVKLLMEIKELKAENEKLKTNKQELLDTCDLWEQNCMDRDVALTEAQAMCEILAEYLEEDSGEGMGYYLEQARKAVKEKPIKEAIEDKRELMDNLHKEKKEN